MEKTVAFCLLVAVLGCSKTPPGDGPKDGRAKATVQPDVVSSVQVGVGRGVVNFVLHVTNTSTQPVVLEFPTSQRYDFIVQSGGTEVWRWSEGQMFSQIVSQETLQPGETRDFTAKMKTETRSGRFSVTARLTTSNRSVEQHADFEIPKP
jgi:hypothetical protein